MPGGDVVRRLFCLAALALSAALCSAQSGPTKTSILNQMWVLPGGTTGGTLYVDNTSGHLAVLGIGSSLDCYLVVTGVPAWSPNCFNVSIANTLTNVTAPGTPASGKTAVWTDSTDKNFKAKDDAGVVTVTVKPHSCTTGEVISEISTAGVATCVSASSAVNTTKGDIYGYDTGANRIPVGANGTYLGADSTAALGVAYSVPKWFGSAVSLKDNVVGSTSYMTVPDNTALDATSGVSVAVWVKVRAWSATSYGLFTKATAAGGTGAAACGDYTLFITSTNTNFSINEAGSCTMNGAGTVTWANPLDLLEWHHVVGTYSTAQGNVKLYVDGELRQTGAAFSSTMNTTGTIGVMGAWFDKSVATRSCYCDIDDLRIYKNAALSAADVRTLYNGGRGQFPLNALSANETVVWRFDQTTGTTDTDVVSSLVLTSAGTTPVSWVRGIIPDK